MAARLGWLLLLLLAAAVALLILLPLLRLAATSVLPEAGFSVAPYVEAFGKARHLAADKPRRRPPCPRQQ